MKVTKQNISPILEEVIEQFLGCGPDKKHNRKLQGEYSLRKQLISLFAASALAATTLLSGCGVATSGAGTKTITFLTPIEPGHGKDYFMENVVAPAFEKQNPGVKLDIISVPWAQFDSKLSTLVAAGTPPDVFSHWGASGFGDYYKRGMIANLSPYMSSFTNKNIPDKLMKTYQVNGKQYGIPFASFPTFLYFNKTLFDQAHIPYPTYNWNDPNWTWDNVVGVAKKLTKNYGNPNAVYGFSMGMGNVDSYGWDWGVDLYDKNAYKTGFPTDANFDNPKYINAIRFFQDLIYKDKVSPTPALLNAVTQTGDPFISGKVAMELTGGWGMGTYTHGNVKFGIAPVPMGPNGTATPVLYTDPLMMSSKTKSPSAAWKLIQFMTTTGEQKVWTKTTGYPPADTMAAEDYYKQFSGNVDPARMKNLTQAAIAVGKESPNHLLAGYSDIYTFLQNQTQPIFLDDKDPAKVLPTLKQPFKQLLNQIKAKSSVK